MKKIIILGVASLIVLAVVFGAYFWYTMGKPLYEPGMVSTAKNLRAPLKPPVQTKEIGFWQVEPDIKLRHFAAGDGKNILMVHGGPGTPYIKPWQGLQELTQTHKFHYYDQRGCGQSSRPIDKFSSANFYKNMKFLDHALGLGAQVADIERIRHILGEEKLIIIAHSFGALLASLYAAEFPDRVKALVLVTPADVLVMPSQEGGLYEAVRKKLPDKMRAEFSAYLKALLDFKNIFSKSEHDLIKLNQDFAKYYMAVTKSTIPQQGAPGGWMVHAMFFSMGKKHDYRSALKTVDAPVLVIHAADDLQSEAASRMYADTFPNANFEIIQNSGHFPFQEEPVRFARVVGNFLSSLD